MGLIIGELYRRGFHEIGRRRDEGTLHSPVQGELGATDGVDDDTG